MTVTGPGKGFSAGEASRWRPLISNEDESTITYNYNTQFSGSFSACIAYLFLSNDIFA